MLSGLWPHCSYPVIEHVSGKGVIIFLLYNAKFCVSLELLNTDINLVINNLKIKVMLFSFIVIVKVNDGIF